MRRGARLGAIGLASALLLAGCSSSEEAAPDDCTSTPTPPQQTDDNQLTSAPKAGSLQPIGEHDTAPNDLRSKGLGWLVRSNTKVLEVGPFVIVGDGSRARFEQTAKGLREVVPIVTGLTGKAFPAHSDVLVLIPERSEDYARIVGKEFSEVSGFAQVRTYPPSVAIRPKTDSVGPQEVLVHELVHVAGVHPPRTPLWLAEGLAEIGVEMHRPAARAEHDEMAATSDRTLPADRPTQQADIRPAYAQGASFMRYLCGLEGRATLMEFHDAVVEGGSTSVEPEIEQHYGHSFDQLKKDWRATLDAETGSSPTT